MPFWGRGHDHIGNFNFRVEIEGIALAAFKEIDGMGSETEVIEYGGTVDQIRRKRPGRTKYFDITLKRGYTNDDTLWVWRKQVVDGQIIRKTGSIVVMSDDQQEIRRWNFFEAWPTKWKGFSLNGKGNSGLVEEITLTLEKLEQG